MEERYLSAFNWVENRGHGGKHYPGVRIIAGLSIVKASMVAVTILKYVLQKVPLCWFVSQIDRPVVIKSYMG